MYSFTFTAFSQYVHLYTFCFSLCPTDLAREKWARVHCQNFWVERRELLPLSDDENFCHFQKYIILEAILDCKMNKTIFQSILICARQKKNSTLWHCQHFCLGFWNPSKNREIWRIQNNNNNNDINRELPIFFSGN